MSSSDANTTNNLQLLVDETTVNIRLDVYLAKQIPDRSRAQIQQWIKQGQVTVNHVVSKTNYRLRLHDHIALSIPKPKVITNQAQAIALDILFEDDDLLVINKPSGLTVHPGAGNPDQTLLNALLHHDSRLAQLPRAGIIHRLDKMTTGLMVVPKHESAFHYLSDAMQKREISRHYLALVRGAMIAGTTIDAPIARHPKNRLKMAISDLGKSAVTHVRIAEKFNHYTLLHCQLETGRTHQIRVHCQMRGYPIVGDPLYADKHSLVKGLDPALRTTIQAFRRQALHAFRLAFLHPSTKKECSFEAPLPDDFQHLLHTLQQYDQNS